MSSDLTEFLGQPFVSSILSMMCFVALLLIATIAALVYVRRRRAQKKLAEMVSPSFTTDPSYTSSTMDMPDLNMLMHTPEVAPVAKPIPPAPSAPAAPPMRAARKGTFAITLKDGNPTEAVEVMSILRDVMDGKLIVQMGDNAYQNINANAEFKERFNKLMREVGQLVNKSVAASPEPADADVTGEASTSGSEPPLALTDLMSPTEPSFLAPKKPLPPPPVTVDGKMPGDLPSFKLDDNPMQRLKRGQKADLPPVPEINIAGAIEAYLQHKLRHTGEHAGRSIHIYPAPGGGVSIEVDGKYFDAVSDVSDDDIREFLANTIAEWQERH